MNKTSVLEPEKATAIKEHSNGSAEDVQKVAEKSNIEKEVQDGDSLEGKVGNKQSMNDKNLEIPNHNSEELKSEAVSNEKQLKNAEIEEKSESDVESPEVKTKINHDSRRRRKGGKSKSKSRTPSPKNGKPANS